MDGQIDQWTDRHTLIQRHGPLLTFFDDESIKKPLIGKQA